MSVTYIAPATLDEALAFLAERGSDCTILAGGMAVVPALKQGALATRCLVNIKGLDLGTAPLVDTSKRTLAFSARVRHRDIETSAVIAHWLPALSRLEQHLASAQVRNHGTLVGNLCAAEPWTDIPCLMAALDTHLELAATRGTRTVPVETWISGPMETGCRPDEIVVRAVVSLPIANEGVGYARLTPRQALARPLACAAARITRTADGRITAARVFIGAIGPCPQRMARVEQLLIGEAIDDALLSDIAEAVEHDVISLPDVRSSESYKKQVAGVLAQRTIVDAVQDATVSKAAA